eukprot:TRINITY_DN1175_c0_g1_i3.p3 TRINITY_DN1175_c0_g1~~TRINITY_DN1175_c0_g1_i3.p3  ORF type:complete len:134 (-),score=31.26 TRINITY_DN1175_c0_g1_i3:7-408(-)
MAAAPEAPQLPSMFHDLRRRGQESIIHNSIASARRNLEVIDETLAQLGQDPQAAKARATEEQMDKIARRTHDTKNACAVFAGNKLFVEFALLQQDAEQRNLEDFQDGYLEAKALLLAAALHAEHLLRNTEPPE